MEGVVEWTRTRYAVYLTYRTSKVSDGLLHLYLWSKRIEKRRCMGALDLESGNRGPGPRRFPFYEWVPVYSKSKSP